MAIKVILLKKPKLSGIYPAIVFGKWFIAVHHVTYAPFSESKFWFSIKKCASKKKK